MEVNEACERNYFIRVGMLMALLGLGFLYYLGSSLYYATQQLYEKAFIEYVDTLESVEQEVS